MNETNDDYRKKEKQLFEEANRLEQMGNKIDAIKKLNILIEFSTIKHFYCSVKARLLLELGKISEALDTVNEGLGYNNQDYILYKMKAEILYQHGIDLNDVDLALQNINAAITYFNTSQYLEEISKFQDLKGLQNWIISSTQNRAEITSLKTAIESYRNILETYHKVLEIESKIDKGKVESVELLGIFTAILALIFSNVQAITKDVRGIDLLWFNLGLVAALSWFLLLIGLVLQKEKPSLFKNPRFWALLFIATVIGWVVYFLLTK